MKKLDNFKKSSMAYALLLASSPVLAGPTKAGGGPPADGSQPSPANRAKLQSLFAGKTQIRIESITLDPADNKKVQNCPVPKVKQKSPHKNKTLSLAFDPKKEQDVTLQFKMARIPTSQDERVLVLLYSRCLPNKPQMRTPLSGIKLALDTRDIQMMGVYNVPVIQPIEPPTPSRPGVTHSQAHTQINFEVALKTAQFAKEIKAGNDTFYLQAALLKKADFEKKNYKTTILSPLETVHLTASESCPTEAQISSAIASENKACENLPTKTE